MSLSALGIVGLLTLAGASRPASLSASFDVRRAPDAADCPDAERLTSAVTGILGRSGAEKPAGNAQVAAEIAFERVAGRAGEGNAYQARMVLRGAREGARTLTDAGPTCAALGRAVAIALALLLDGPENAPAPTAPSPPVTPPAPPPGAAPSSPPLPATPPTAEASPPEPAGAEPGGGGNLLRPTAGFVALRGGPAWGYVGQLSWAAGLEFGVHLGRHVSLLAGAGQVLPQKAALAPGSVAVSLRSAHLAACDRFFAPTPSLQLAACALASGGVLRGEGQGFSSSNAATLTWWAAGGELRAEALLGDRWLLALAADVEVPLHSYTFSVAEVGTVRGANRWVGQLLLGVGVKLW